ncbi:MAG: hypothetical protein R3Y43_07990 [Alphaproteobacteria bacterium]
MQRQVNSLVHLNASNNDQNIYLEKIIKTAKENNHNVYIVLSPYSPELKKYMPQDINLWKKLQIILQNNPEISLIDSFSNFSINQKYFMDNDHLNKQGAEYLTKKIFDVIKNNYK